MDKATQHLLEKLTQALNETNTLLRRATSPERQHYAQPDQPKDAAKDEGQSAPREIPFLSHADPSPPTNQKTKKRWYRSKNIGKDVVQWATLASALFYAYVTHQQWRDANRHFTDDERPYIFSTNLSLPKVSPYRSDALQTDVSYANFGKSPAFHVKVVSTILSGDISYEKWFHSVEDRDLETTDAGIAQHRPGGSMPDRVVVPSEPAGQTVVGIGGPSDPTAAFAVVMRIQYQDLAGHMYWNDVCWMHVQNTAGMLRCFTRNN